MAPYERASLIAWALKRDRPRSRVVILDAKDGFPAQALFQQAWAQLFPGMIEWVPAAQGGRVVAVDAAAMTLTTAAGAAGGAARTVKADVASVIPPQRAGAAAQAAGVADRTGWCPVDPVTFESQRVARVHVIGDAGGVGAHPQGRDGGSGAGQGVRRCGDGVAGGGRAAAAEADRHGIQPGSAGVWSVGGGGVCGDGRAVDGGGGGGRAECFGCAGLRAGGGGGLCGGLVQDADGPDVRIGGWMMDVEGDGVMPDRTESEQEQVIAFAGRMFDAARNGDVEKIGPMLDKGLPPNLRNDKGDTLLMLAAYHGHAAVVRRLLQAGADANLANDRGQLPIAGAAFKDERAIVEALLEGGADPNASGADGRTGLMLAAMFDRVELVTLLLAHGGDRGLRDAAGNTARDLAVAMGAKSTPGLLEG